MKYRHMGKSGLVVSEIALGSWMTALHSAEERETAEKTIRTAYEEGVTFFDCADCYSGGEAEKFLGKVLADFPRSSYVLSSKVYFPTGKAPTERGLSRKHILENVDRSLKNLGVDYLDLYYCHRFDETTPLEETLRTLSDLVSQGKILYYGVSEGWSASRIAKAQAVIDRYNLYPITTLQPQYHLMDRYIEHELTDLCTETGIGITPFSPLAQGLLTGKYRKGEPFPKGSRATLSPTGQVNELLTDENLDRVEELRKIADDLGLPLPVMALAWILREPSVASVIIGASNEKQLLANLNASGVVLPADALAAIDRVLGFTRFNRSIG